MEIRQYLAILRKHWWAILLIGAIAGLVSLFISLQQKPLYKSSTTIAISPAAPNLLFGFGLSERAQDLVPSYVEFMRGDAFVALVVQTLSLPDVGEDVIRRAITTEGIPNTVLFRISATHERADYAQLLANTVARVFIDQNRQQQEQRRLQAEGGLPTGRAFDELLAPLEDQNKYYTSIIADLRRRIGEQEALPPSLERDRRLQDMRAELLQTEEMRIRVLNGLADLKAKAASVRASDPDTVIVVNQARLPEAPLPSSAPRNVLTAVFVSLALATAGAMLWEQLDYTFKTPEDVDAEYGMPTLGLIGVLGLRRGSKDERERLVTVNAPRSSASEAYRSLRTTIQLAAAAKPIRSLLVTSASPGEGKSVTAANLAVAFAQTGLRVLLVDLDLRRPSLQRIFGISEPGGFTSLLMDERKQLAEYAHQTAVEQLRVLCAGPLPPNPSELLGSTRASALIRQLCAGADWVIFDSPPAGTVTDAVILAPQMDAVVQVVMAGATRKNLVLNARDVLRRTQCRLLGPVVNRVKMGDIGYYHHYYTQYYDSASQPQAARAPSGGAK